MKKELIHTPEGVRDIYGLECAKKLTVQNQIHKSIRSFGYQDIQTPAFEFLDVFGEEIGTTPTKDLFRFFDNEGNTLCLRSDFTPSMARCTAKYFMDEKLPIRYTYMGSAFSNTNMLQGKWKETTQMGAELMGDGSVEADGEVLSMCIEALVNTGLTEFQVSVGQVDFFRGLCEEFAFEEAQSEAIRQYIKNRNFLALEEYMSGEGISRSVIDTFLKIEDLFGTKDILEQAKALVNNTVSLKAIDRLESLYSVLEAYDVEDYISFDFSMLSSYHYYTGIIFKVFTHGIGDVIVKGGRYDNLLGKFGKDRAAIGFVIVIDDLMQALSRQKIEIKTPKNNFMVIYDKTRYKEALRETKKLRSKGFYVQMIPYNNQFSLVDYEAYATRTMHSKLIFLTQ